MTSTATTRRRHLAAGAVPMTPATDLAGIRAAVDTALNKLGAALVESPAPDAELQELQQRVALLGKLAAGLAVVDAECLPPIGAGYGSRVTVENLDTGATDEYMLMVGSLLDIDTDQVSLVSPIGQALLGQRAGDVVTIATPTKRVSMRVVSVVTLGEYLQTASAPLLR